MSSSQKGMAGSTEQKGHGHVDGHFVHLQIRWARSFSVTKMVSKLYVRLGGGLFFSCTSFFSRVFLLKVTV